MKKIVFQFISMMITIAVIFANYHSVNASSSISPLQRFKTDDVAQTGNDIVLSGNYGSLNFSQVGTETDPVVIYGNGATATSINITGRWIELRGIRVIGSNGHGIYINGQNIVIENNTVMNAEKDRLSSDGKNCSGSGGWGSGIKVHVGGQNITIRGNTVYENCGEGIAVTRGVNVLVENNTVRDNFSVNIYIDNSNFVTVRNNQVSCTGIFLRNGNRPAGIAIAEEEYAGWGLQRHDNKVLSNFVDGCYVGISSWDSEASGGKEIRLLVEGNTVRNTYWIRSIDLKTNNTDVIVRNNISDKLVYIRYPAGVTLSNNVIGGAVVTPSRTPTRTATTTKTATPTKTLVVPISPTTTKTATPTKTLVVPISPTTTKTATPTKTLVAPISSPTPTKTPTLTATLVAPASPTPTTQSGGTETTYDDTHNSFVYSTGWEDVDQANAYNGSYKINDDYNASVILSFEGVSFSILYTDGSIYRQMSVYVDGVLVQTIKRSTSNIKYQKRWDYPGVLASGTHTIELVFLNGNGTFDAIIVR